MMSGEVDLLRLGNRSKLGKFFLCVGNRSIANESFHFHEGRFELADTGGVKAETSGERGGLAFRDLFAGPFEGQ